MLGRFVVNKGDEIQKSCDSNVTLARRCKGEAMTEALDRKHHGVCALNWCPCIFHIFQSFVFSILIVFFVAFPPYAIVSDLVLISTNLLKNKKG